MHPQVGGSVFSQVGGRVLALTTAEDNVIKEIISVFIIVICVFGLLDKNIS